jgi:hypothetical protein
MKNLISGDFLKYLYEHPDLAEEEREGIRKVGVAASVVDSADGEQDIFAMWQYGCGVRYVLESIRDKHEDIIDGYFSNLPDEMLGAFDVETEAYSKMPALYRINSQLEDRLKNAGGIDFILWMKNTETPASNDDKSNLSRLLRMMVVTAGDSSAPEDAKEFLTWALITCIKDVAYRLFESNEWLLPSYINYEMPKKAQNG